MPEGARRSDGWRPPPSAPAAVTSGVGAGLLAGRVGCPTALAARASKRIGIFTCMVSLFKTVMQTTSLKDWLMA